MEHLRSTRVLAFSAGNRIVSPSRLRHERPRISFGRHSVSHANRAKSRKYAGRFASTLQNSCGKNPDARCPLRSAAQLANALCRSEPSVGNGQFVGWPQGSCKLRLILAASGGFGFFSGIAASLRRPCCRACSINLSMGVLLSPTGFRGSAGVRASMPSCAVGVPGVGFVGCNCSRRAYGDDFFFKL